MNIERNLHQNNGYLPGHRRHGHQSKYFMPHTKEDLTRSSPLKEKAAVTVTLPYKRRRAKRTVWAPEQLHKMMTYFQEVDRKPSHLQIMEDLAGNDEYLAGKIQIWFQNRRATEKKKSAKSASNNSSSSSPTFQPSSSSSSSSLSTVFTDAAKPSISLSSRTSAPLSDVLWSSTSSNMMTAINSGCDTNAEDRTVCSTSKQSELSPATSTDRRPPFSVPWKCVENWSEEKRVGQGLRERRGPLFPQGQYVGGWNAEAGLMKDLSFNHHCHQTCGLTFPSALYSVLAKSGQHDHRASTRYSSDHAEEYVRSLSHLCPVCYDHIDVSPLLSACAPSLFFPTSSALAVHCSSSTQPLDPSSVNNQPSELNHKTDVKSARPVLGEFARSQSVGLHLPTSSGFACKFMDLTSQFVDVMSRETWLSDSAYLKAVTLRSARTGLSEPPWTLLPSLADHQRFQAPLSGYANCGSSMLSPDTFGTFYGTCQQTWMDAISDPSMPF